MPGVEEIPEIVKITTTMIPALQNIRLIRGLIIPLSSAGEMNQAKALEELQSELDKKKKTRQKLRDRQNIHVIKIKDAMQCVENSLNATVLLKFGKGILNVITGRSVEGGLDLLYDEINQCMLQKALQQKNKKSHGLFEQHERHKSGDAKKVVYSENVRLRRGKLHPFLKPQ